MLELKKSPKKVHQGQKEADAETHQRVCDGVMGDLHGIIFITKLCFKKPTHLQSASSTLVWSGQVWLVLAGLLVPFHTGYTLSPLWPGICFLWAVCVCGVNGYCTWY